MDPGSLLHPEPARELEQRSEVLEVRVDAAGRDEPEQVDVAAARPGALERLDERVVLGERAVPDRLVHPHQVLVEDPARADRQVADLRVPHLARRQADRLAGGLEGRVRVLAPEPVEDGRVGELDRVAGAGRSAAPAVEDDERYEGEAARQIAANESGSSEAPPTSAPSSEGWASSSAAFSGLTEPP